MTFLMANQDSLHLNSDYFKAKDLLLRGEIQEFRKFADSWSDFSGNHVFTSADASESQRKISSFPILLVQSYRAKYSENTTGNVQDYVDCLQWLVHQKGASVNFQDHLGRSVAHWAVLLSVTQVLKVLLQWGCDAFLQDVEGESLVHLAVRVSCLESLKVLHELGPPALLESPSVTSGATPLIYAVQITAPEMVEHLLELGVDPDRQESNEYRRTALHYALYTEQLSAYEALLSHGASPHIPDYRGKTVLQRLEDSTDSAIRQVTEKYAPSINSKKENTPEDALTPLMAACVNEDVDEVKRLLAQPNALESTRKLDKHLRTALHHCAENGTLECIEALLAFNPAMLQWKDLHGLTLLHLTAIHGNSTVLRILLERYSASVNTRDYQEHTSLHWAVIRGQLEVLEVLLPHHTDLAPADKFGARPLHYAVKACSEDTPAAFSIAEKLLDSGAPVDAVDLDGRTAFLWSSSLGDLKTCVLLVTAGAKVDHADGDGLDALHYAANRGSLDMVRFLLEKCQHPMDVRDKDGRTPLFYAVNGNHTEVVKVLLAHHADPNVSDARHRTPSHCAASKMLPVMLQLLIDHGADPWKKDVDGNLPLHEVCHKGHPVTASLLLRNLPKDADIGAFLNSKANDGYTPLHKAAIKGSIPVCRLLVDSGVEINLLSQGKTALDLTSSDKCAEFLRSIGGKKALEMADASSKRTSISLQRSHSWDGFIKEAQKVVGTPPSHKDYSSAPSSPRKAVYKPSNQSPQKSKKYSVVKPAGVSKNDHEKENDSVDSTVTIGTGISSHSSSKASQKGLQDNSSHTTSTSPRSHAPPHRSHHHSHSSKSHQTEQYPAHSRPSPGDSLKQLEEAKIRSLKITSKKVHDSVREFDRARQHGLDLLNLQRARIHQNFNATQLHKKGRQPSSHRRSGPGQGETSESNKATQEANPQEDESSKKPLRYMLVVKNADSRPSAGIKSAKIKHKSATKAESSSPPEEPNRTSPRLTASLSVPVRQESLLKIYGNNGTSAKPPTISSTKQRKRLLPSQESAILHSQQVNTLPLMQHH